MSEDTERYYKKIRYFVFNAEDEERLEVYFEANEIGPDLGEEFRQRALGEKRAIFKGKGVRKLVIGFFVLGVSLMVFFMTEGMFSSMKLIVNNLVYGGVAIASLFISSGLLDYFMPQRYDKEKVDPTLY